jgi:hypothetical protein
MPLTASNIDPATRAVIRVDASGLLPPASTVSFIIPIHCSTGSGTEAAAGTGLKVARATNRAIKNRLVVGNERFLTGIFVFLPFKEFEVLTLGGNWPPKPQAIRRSCFAEHSAGSRGPKSQGSYRKFIGIGKIEAYNHGNWGVHRL